jgi:pentapeptide MXKDX repeat protein
VAQNEPLTRTPEIFLLGNQGLCSTISATRDNPAHLCQAAVRPDDSKTDNSEGALSNMKKLLALLFAAALTLTLSAGAFAQDTMSQDTSKETKKEQKAEKKAAKKKAKADKKAAKQEKKDEMKTEQK